MKKVFIILIVLIASVSFAFADESHKGLSVGVDSTILFQGLSARYDFGRWAEVEGALRLPIVVAITEMIENSSDGKAFDLYSLASGTLSLSGYATPLEVGFFSLGLGLALDAQVFSNGPWVKDEGESTETKMDFGSSIFFTAGPAVKLQFDFDDWGFNIKGRYPLLGEGIEIGDVNASAILSQVFGIAFNALSIGFDFKV